MLGKKSRSNPMAACWRDHHVVKLDHLRLQSLTRSDTTMMNAAGSDADAQRWLGWHKQLVIRQQRCGSLLAKQPGRGRALAGIETQWHLIAVDLASGLLAGAVGGNLRDGTVGGWLAPQFRGRGLGAELFSGAAQFAHAHLGQERVLAGTEPANAPCIRALLSAGFTPTAGPDAHRLPDGRVVPACWFHHPTDRPARCD